MPTGKNLALHHLSISELKTLHALYSARIQFQANHTDEQIKVSIKAGLIKSYLDFHNSTHSDIIVRQQVKNELMSRKEILDTPELWQDPNFF